MNSRSGRRVQQPSHSRLPALTSSVSSQISTERQIEPAARLKKSGKLDRSTAGPESSLHGPMAELFPLEFVSSLATRFEIEPNRIPELKRLLEIWADVYRSYVRPDHPPRTGSIRPALSQIAAQAAGLRKSLERLDPYTARLFWAPEAFIEPLIHAHHPDHVPDGHRILEIGAGQWLEVPPDQNAHLASLRIMERYAGEALSRLRPDRGGHRRSFALSMWVHNVRGYWKETLGRTFALKSGGAFCIEAFKAIDASRGIERRLRSTMRGILYPPKNTSTRSK